MVRTPGCAAAGAGVAVYEVGLGGRFDATNVIVPEACAITTIAVLEIRLPTTGSMPTTKVMTTSVFRSGSSIPKIGSATRR